MWICDALSGFVELSYELTVVKKNRRVCDSFLDMLNCPVNSTFLRKIYKSLPAMLLFHELTIVEDNVWFNIVVFWNTVVENAIWFITWYVELSHELTVGEDNRWVWPLLSSMLNRPMYTVDVSNMWFLNWYVEQVPWTQSHWRNILCGSLPDVLNCPMNSQLLKTTPNRLLQLLKISFRASAFRSLMLISPK